jgi:hypothetical protein
VGEIHPDLFVEDLLHAKDLLEFVGLGHATFVALSPRRGRLFCTGKAETCEKEPRDVSTASAAGDMKSR